MGVLFSADELLAIAEQIERNAAAFYATAARSVPARAGKLLRELADWERQHEGIFAAMRAELTEREREPMTSDPFDEAALYLEAVAAGRVFPVGEDPLNALGEAPTPAHIFAVALEREKDSIVFYTAMQETVPARQGQQRVTAIIREEIGHVARLNAERAKLGG